MIDLANKTYVPLGSFLEEYCERNENNEFRPVAVGRYGIRSRESIYSKELAKDYSKNKLIHKDTLTVGMGSVQIDIGILTDDVTHSVSPAYRTYKISGIDSAYLRYCLQCRNLDMFERYVKRGSRQGKTIDVKRWMTYEIPVYNIGTQREIVIRLEKALEIVALRQEQLRTLEELVKLRFLEIFGSPVANPKKWKILSFREASFRLSDGPFGSNLKSEHYTDQGVRVIRLGNIGKGVFIDDDKSFVSIEHYEKLKKYTCKAGEIVIATLGDPNLRACIIPDSVKYAINKADCVHYIPKPEILNTEFVCHYINCPETLLLASSMMHGQTRTRISSGQIAKLPIFLPPLELQNQFATFVQKVNNLKFVVQKSIDETQLLFDSLMQKYFS